jgi:hypothetical protein
MFSDISRGLIILIKLLKQQRLSCFVLSSILIYILDLLNLGFDQ